MHIYIYVYIYKQCSGMQGLYAQLTGEDLSPFYIYMYRCSVVVVCKASVLD